VGGTSGPRHWLRCSSSAGSVERTCRASHHRQPGTNLQVLHAPVPSNDGTQGLENRRSIAVKRAPVVSAAAAVVFRNLGEPVRKLGSLKSGKALHEIGGGFLVAFGFCLLIRVEVAGNGVQIAGHCKKPIF